MTDDLSAPLGQNKPRKRWFIPTAHLTRGAVVALSVALLGFAGWAMFSEDPLGGEPMVVVSADLPAPQPQPTAAPGQQTAIPVVTTPPPVAPAAPSTGNTITIIDGSTGKRQEVRLPEAGGGASPEGKAASGNERLLEPSPNGPLPRIAEDGTRPADAYAQPVKLAADKANLPRIALVVTGLGIGANSTKDALTKLPGAVTLSFNPYAGELPALTTQARASGHELLLQVPMEPFDYPDNDPGPQTLLTSLDPAQNLDRLHWAMGRFSGYVGLVNYMGSRLSTSEPAFGPVLRETAKRGLIYVDDGSSPRSLASEIAGANNLAFVKATATIDAVPNAVEIDRALGRLEAVARERGSAVGFASALPVSIERIAKWAKAAESRGLLLVPISAAVPKPKQS